MPEQDGLELRTYLAVLRRWWWLVLVCTLLAGGVAFLVMNSRAPLYEAATTLLIKPGQDAKTSEYNLLVAGERLALTYAQMIKGKPVLDTIITAYGLEETPESLARKISAVPIRDTQLILLTVADSSAEQAALIANALAEAFTEYTQTLNTQRYAVSLESLQEEIDTFSESIDEIQSQVDTLTASKIEAETNLTRLESSLGSSQEEYRIIQQDYSDLQLIVNQLKGNVKIAESANVPESDLQPPFIATVSLLFEDDQLASTYIQMLSWQPVLEAVIEQLGLDITPETLANKIATSPISGAQLVRINVSDNDSAQAVILADAFAGEFVAQVQDMLAQPYSESLNNIQSQMEDLSGGIDQIEEEINQETTVKIQSETELVSLETSLAENRSDRRSLLQDYQQLLLTASSSSETITVTEPARVPINSSQSNFLFIALATLVGFMIGIGAAFLLEYLDDTIKSPDVIRQALGMDTIGTIPRLSNQDQDLISVAQPRSPISETFRMLGNNLRVYGEEKPLRTILVTSPNPEEGKSVLSANLAVTLAASGLKTALVDADLRRPRQQELFKLKSNEGLTGCLLDGIVDGKLQPTKVAGLSVITCGEYLPSYPTELLNSQSMAKILDQLTSQFDIILIDSPPMLAFADAAVLAPLMDGVLLVLKSGETRLAEVKQSVENLEHVRANLIGLVLNGAPIQKNRYSYYYQERKTRSRDSNRKQIRRKTSRFPSIREWLYNRR